MGLLREQLYRDLSKARSSILDLAQTSITNPHQWRIVRKHILRVLGRNGLEGKLMALAHLVEDDYAFYGEPTSIDNSTLLNMSKEPRGKE